MCNLFNLPQVHTINLVHVQLYTDACFIACFMPILFETMEKLFEIMFFFRGVPVLHSRSLTVTHHFRRNSRFLEQLPREHTFFSMKIVHVSHGTKVNVPE